MHTRYEIVIDPFDRYMIWDRWRQTPAEWAGEPLVGPERHHRACSSEYAQLSRACTGSSLGISKGASFPSKEKKTGQDDRSKRRLRKEPAIGAPARQPNRAGE